MPRLPIEDNAGDVVGKAMRGLRLEGAELAARSGLSATAIRLARQGKADAAVFTALAPHLHLDAGALVVLARNGWYPRPVEFTDGFAMFTTEFEGMDVNSYLVWDPQSKRAAAFDTGATSEPLLQAAQERGLKIALILLTHTHDDHIADLDRLVAETRAPVWASEREPIAGGQTFTEGHVFSLGDLSIRTLSTWGHSPGGATYVVTGLSQPLAIVGDSLFASSMGGGLISYDDAYRNVAEKILVLPAATVLACGHGPLTTVGEEKRHNPFFAG
jgi:hydroxyacylglutathione hydrolase